MKEADLKRIARFKKRRHEALEFARKHQHWEKAFAWCPVTLREGYVIWLEHYYRRANYTEYYGGAKLGPQYYWINTQKPDSEVVLPEPF